MIMRFIYSLYIILLLSISRVSYAIPVEALSVILPKQNLQLNYPQPVRLEQILSDTHKHVNFYEFGAVLSNNQLKKSIERLQKESTEQLRLLSRETSLFSSHKKFKHSATHVISQLENQTFVGRIFSPLDIDLIRINEKLNPILNGSYQLFVGSRPTSVSFFGAIESKESIKLPLIEHATIDEYVKLLTLSPIAETSIIYVIHPNGEVQMAESSLWQSKPVYLTPGAAVYIPLGGLPSNFSSLNDSIVQLLRNKAF